KPADPHDYKPIEIKPNEPKPVEPRPIEQKHTDHKPIEQKPIEQNPIEHKASDYKPLEHKPADSKPLDPKPIEKPFDLTGLDQKQVDHKPFDSKPAPQPNLTHTPAAGSYGAPSFDLSPSEDEVASAFDDHSGGSKKRWWPAAAAVAVLALAGVAVPSVRRMVAPATAAEGTLNVTTNPPGAHLFVDGVERGVTPVTVPLKPGPHSLEVRGDGEPRLMPVTITAGAQVSQYLDLPKAAAAVGQLVVRTEPAGARVTVDGVGRGASPVTVAALAPGEHTVVVESDLGSVKQTVVVEGGNTASLTVPLGAPEGAPVSGWLALNAPAELQIYENKRLVG